MLSDSQMPSATAAASFLHIDSAIHADRAETVNAIAAMRCRRLFLKNAGSVFFSVLDDFFG